MEDPDTNRPGHAAGEPYRDNGPDALFGAVLAMEALLGALVGQAAAESSAIHGSPSLAMLRRRVEAAVAHGQHATKYGTGGRAIADGAQHSLDAVFAAAEKEAARGSPAPAVNAP